jgi:serine phosphatase RsbU (regulator of sigma subunit)/pSer/pThr/pTyr-binding forkhead associated (FHA) protein
LDYNPATSFEPTVQSSIGLSAKSTSKLSPGLVLHLRDGLDEHTVPLERFPVTVGRKPEKDIVLKDARVSRDHARFSCEEGIYFIEDEGSRHGTYVNGQRINGRIEIHPGDHIQFGPSVTAALQTASASNQQVLELLSQIHVPTNSKSSELEKLTLFLEAARALSSSNVLTDVLSVLLDTCLALTGAERGFVFLRDAEGGEMKLAVGRNNKKEPITTDKGISHSILRDTVSSADEFIVADTTKLSDMAARQSIVAHDLRSVISVPLRMTVQQNREGPQSSEIRGVLYLDSQFISGDLSKVDHQILKAIAGEAAMLLENAVLMQAEEARRRYQQELSIAAGIQQGLMPARLPDVPFARVRARNVSCREIGGDFYDVLYINGKLNIVLADVSGKGVSAALLAAILQGLIYSQLMEERTLADAASAINQFLCSRDLGGKYATFFLGRIHPDGNMEWIRCGHVPPVRIQPDKSIERWEEGSMPVGLIPIADFEMHTGQLKPGDRFIVVSDGITEAENPVDDLFGEERLEGACQCDDAFTNIMEQVANFRGSAAQNDDITLVEVTFSA